MTLRLTLPLSHPAWITVTLLSVVLVPTASLPLGGGVNNVVGWNNVGNTAAPPHCLPVPKPVRYGK